MWLLDGRAVTDVIAAGRLESIPHDEWFRLGNPFDGAGTAAEPLREQLEPAAVDAAAPHWPEPRAESWPRRS